MPPKIDESYLRNATETQLLSRMLEVLGRLEDEPSPAATSKGLVAELSRKEYLVHASADIQVVTACCFSAILTVSPPLPKAALSDAACLSVFKLLAATVRRLVVQGSAKSSFYIYVRRMLELLAARHGVAAVAQRLAVSDVRGGDAVGEELFQTIFDVTTDDSSLMTQLATVAGDLLDVSAASDSEVAVLLKVIRPAHGNATARTIARAVLRQKEAALAPAVAGYVGHEMDLALEAVAAPDFHDAGAEGQEEGGAAAVKGALTAAANVLESCIAACALSANLVADLVPRLQVLLTAEDNSIRMLAMRTFTRIFSATPALTTAFAAAHGAFLGRFADARPQIRSEMVRHAAAVLTTQSGAALDASWIAFATGLINKLVDSDEGVRKAAVAAVADIALATPRRVPNKVYEALSQRCKDKSAKVRALAVERLAQLFLKTRLRWIPNCLFTSGQVGQPLDALELAIYDAIPQPASAVSAAAAAASKKRQTTLHDKPLKRAGTKFDFESGSDDDNDNAAGAGADAKPSVVVDPTPLGGFIQFCAALDDPVAWQMMATMMGKRAKLREIVCVLIALRKAVKARDNTEANAAKAVRLMSVLCAKTNASDEWSALFYLKDDTAMNCLGKLCDPACTNLAAAGDTLVSRCKAIANKELARFLSTSLVKRLSLPLDEADGAALLERIERARKDKSADQVGLLRALHAMTVLAPQLVAASALTHLVRWVKEDSEQCRREQNPEATAAMRVALTVLDCVSRTDGIKASLAANAASKKEIVSTLGKICLTSEQGTVAKSAARCLAALYKGDKSAFAQLAQKVQERLAAAAAQGEAGFVPATVAHIKTFAVFVEADPDAILLSSDLIAESLRAIFLAAMQAHRAEDDADAAKAKGHLVARRTALVEVADAAAKALVRYVLSLPGNRAPAAARALFDTLVDGIRAAQKLPAGTVGWCLRRLAAVQQLVRLLLHGEPAFAASDGAGSSPLELLRRELTVMLLCSVEENAEVRHTLQAKLAGHVTKGLGSGGFVGSARHAAMLAMTAIAEDTKAGYLRLKATFAEVAAKMRLHREQHKCSLSDPAATRCFLEYAVPTLVMYMAHHPSYAEGRDDPEEPFRHFSRPWQLLLDEVFSQSTDGAGAMQELFRKLRGLDDAVPDPAEPVATRVVCDLGAKVMLAVLAEKAMAPAAPFLGTLLLPWHFKQPADPKRYDPATVFLASNVAVTARPLFGVPVGTHAPSSMAANRPSQTPGRHAPSQSAARASLPPLHFGGAADEDNSNAAPPSATKGSAVKRPRSAAGEAASPQPKAAPAAKGKSTTAAAMPDIPDGSALDSKEQATIFKAVVAATKGHAAAELARVPFGEIKTAVQAALGKPSWTDDQRTYAKSCVRAVLDSLS